MSQKGKPPRRRDLVPALGKDRAAQDEVPQMGFPIKECLTGTVADTEQSIDELTKVAGALTLPSPDDGKASAVAGLYKGQVDLAYLVARALDRANRKQVPLKTDVTPAALQLGRQKSYVLYSGKRTAIQGQNLAADGRLFLGAKFSFYFKKLLEAYHRRLTTGPLEQRLRAAAAMASVDKIRFRLLTQVQQAHKDTAAERDTLKQDLQAQQDEAAFDKARNMLEQGQRPDVETLQRANRHAAKLQDQYGLSLDRRTETR